MPSSEPVVLCIIGKGRSGSTLLDMMLGQIEGVFSTGELGRLWEWGLLGGYRCGCGHPLPDCPVWSAVVGRTLGDEPDGRARTVAAWQREVLSWQRVPRLLRQRPGRVSGWAALEDYTDHLGGLYRAIAAVTGAGVIVDSTKWPAGPTPLGLVPGVETRVVHLVRDPRAVAHSWRRRKRWRDRPGDPEMPRYGAMSSVASWWARNLTAEAVCRRHPPQHRVRLRYEDLVEHPRDTLLAAARLAGRDSTHLPLDGRTVRLGTTHTVGGNPGRLERGAVELRMDDAWVGEQSTRDQMLVGLLTAPLLPRYGYPLRPGRASPPEPTA